MEAETMKTNVETTTAAAEDMLQFVTFTLNEEEYAVDILSVQEINRIIEITRVPNAPPHVEGVINLRGKVIPVINLRRKFGFPETEHRDSSRIIIMDIRGITTGVIVDAVSEVLRIPSSIVEPSPPMSSEENARYIKGLAKLDNRLIILLDIDRLVDDVEENIETERN
jgi:purine-binding chemotaxis protein CheW